MSNRFIVTDTVPEAFLIQLKELGFKVDYYPDVALLNFDEAIKTANGIVMHTKLKLDAEAIDKAKNLKYVLRPGSGLDNIDIEELNRKGIAWFSSPEANAPAVGEHAVGLMIDCCRNITSSCIETQNLIWKRKENTGLALTNSTIALIGYGHTGKATAKRLSGFGARLIAYDPYIDSIKDDDVEQVEIQEVFDTADIVSFHIPLNEETSNLVDIEYLEKFKKPITLINTSRGGILSLEDLLVGIEKGYVLKAALDVLPMENPDKFTEAYKSLLERLYATGKLITTPHIAGWNMQSRKEIFMVVLEKLRNYLQNNSSKKE